MIVVRIANVTVLARNTSRSEHTIAGALAALTKQIRVQLRTIQRMTRIPRTRPALTGLVHIVPIALSTVWAAQISQRQHIMASLPATFRLR